MISELTDLVGKFICHSIEKADKKDFENDPQTFAKKDGKCYNDSIQSSHGCLSFRILGNRANGIYRNGDTAMKNHIKIDGKLLQTNKKWSQLKESQKAWIYDISRIEYEKYIAEKSVPPKSRKKDIIIDTVYSKIEAKEIWIPYSEVKRILNKFIDKQNRKKFPAEKLTEKETDEGIST